jgi:dihydrolipoamide dehydrogenase
MEYDLIVIGGGSGLNVASAAAKAGKKVAVIEEGPLGGTCLNRGCIPSKMVIHSADVAEGIRNAEKIGLKAKITGINFSQIMTRAYREVSSESKAIEAGIKRNQNMTLYKTRAKFTGVRTLAVGNKQIRGQKVVVAAGTRPTAPPINGLDKVNYLTSDSVWELRKAPKSMIVMGGGFIAAELAHFFGELGTKVTVSQRSIMLREEDREIADTFTSLFSEKHTVVLGWTPVEVKQKGKIVTLVVEKGKKRKTLAAESLLIATGRVPNTDILDVKKGKIDIDERGYVKTNDFLETSSENVWALGDIAGKYLLKHSANLEAKYVFNNMYSEKKPVDYWPMPHAIFTSPQIAAVGYTEEELKEKKTEYAVGKYYYKDSGMGLALAEENGFAKILAGRDKKILGVHIIGPDASAIIHEAIVAMKLGAAADQLAEVTHIHPALSEVVQRAAANIKW